MKQLITLALFLHIGSGCLAQTLKQWQPYIRGGVGAGRAIGEATAPERRVLFVGDPYGELPHAGGRHWLVAGSVGVGVVKPIGGNMYVLAEVNSEQKGSLMKLEEEVEYRLCGIVSCSIYSPTGRYLSRATYLTLPILVGYKSGNVSVAAGPYASLKLAETKEGYYTSWNPDEKLPIKEPATVYKAADVGFAVAVTYAATSRVAVDLRYSQGVIPFVKPSPQVAEKSYHQTAQLGLRYNLLR